MFDASVRWLWLTALLLAVSGGCGKYARDDPADSPAASAGGNAAAEAGSEASPTKGGRTQSGGTSSGGTSSGGSPNPPLASGGEADCGPLIDDLESGSGHICTGSGRVGVWYAFNDMTGEQWPAPTTPGVPIPTSVIPGGRGASTRAIHSYGKGFSGWGAGVGLDFAFDGVSYGVFDASAFDGIRFWARSDVPQKLQVRIGTRATKLPDYGGTCAREPCSPHARDFDVAADWVELSLPFNDLTQLGPHSSAADFLRDELTHLQFMPQTRQFDFWIDDVRFYRDRNCCTAPPAGCQSAIEFRDAVLEDRVRRSVGKRRGDLRCEDVCAVSPLVRSGLAQPAQLTDLAGLQCLLGLTRLDLTDNQIADIHPLATLARVTSLELGRNQIRDAAPLSGLHALQSLDLRGNRLASLTGLSDLPSLAWLSLDDNQLSELSPAAKLSALTVLSANRNQLVDVRALAVLPALTALSVESNPLVDLAQFLEFPNIQAVYLAGSPARCTPEEANVVRTLLARGVQVSYGNVGNDPVACVLQ